MVQLGLPRSIHKPYDGKDGSDSTFNFLIVQLGLPQGAFKFLAEERMVVLNEVIGSRA